MDDIDDTAAVEDDDDSDADDSDGEEEEEEEEYEEVNIENVAKNTLRFALFVLLRKQNNKNNPLLLHFREGIKIHLYIDLISEPYFRLI